jgi:hypothetical protein
VEYVTFNGRVDVTLFMPQSYLPFPAWEYRITSHRRDHDPACSMSYATDVFGSYASNCRALRSAV